MRLNNVKALWRQNKPATIGWLSSGDSYITEAMANAGYDAVVIDMQHGMGITADRAIACLQIISTTDTVPIVRVPWNDPLPIQLVLDAGAYGVIVPLVNSYEEAVKAVGACRYPPLGYRSIGPNRASFYAGADYAEHANDEIIVLVMIETTEAVSKLEEIATVPGLDGFYIGPADLAVSLGLTPGPDVNENPLHAAACQRVVDVANATGLIPCHHGPGPEETARRFAQGFRMGQIASDIDIIKRGAVASIKALQEAMDKK